MPATKIVVLDGHGAESRRFELGATVRSIGECRVFDRTPADQVVARAHDAEIIFTTARTRLPAEILRQLKRRVHWRNLTVTMSSM